MPEVVTLAWFLGALAIGLALGMLIGATFLRTAITLYNKMAGGATSPGSVPEPALGKAMWITLAIFMVQLIAGSLIHLGTSPGTAGAGRKRVDVVAQLVSFPIGLLTMAAVLSAKLPTTFGRAILVALCYMLVVLVVACVLAVIAIAVFGVDLRRA
jgi:hypothetical protein